MGIIIDEKTVAIVQGVTGKQGSFHTKLMLDYGTRIVAGVTPGKSGAEVNGVPVYDKVEEAKREHSPDASIVFVPAPFAADAAYEALSCARRARIHIFLATSKIHMQYKLKKAEDEIISLVDQLLQLNQEKAEAKLQTTISHLEGKIDYCENRINQIVYQLYDLTEEEIKIVEGK